MNDKVATLLAAGQCVRVVPSRVKAGQVEAWVAAHRVHHTPVVRRQPGFVAKVLMQAETDPQCVAMLLVWESSEQALAWTKRPEHDTSSAPVGAFVDRSGGRVEAAPRGGYRILEVVTERGGAE